MSAVRQSIVIPCYDEAENLPALIAGFEALRRPDSAWELVLVNNGSRDASAEVLARELAPASRAFVRVVTVPANVGYGHGLMAGLRAAHGELLAWTHADGQTPPGDAVRALEVLAASPQPSRTFVKGRRRNRPARDALFTMGMQAAARVLIGPGFEDVNGQPKAFPRALLDRATAAPVDLSLDLYFYWLALREGYDVLRFDVRFGDRAHGESKWAFSWSSKARNIARTLRFMRALRSGGDYPRA